MYRSLIDLIILFTQYITTLLSDVICHNGFTKEKVMLHSKESFQFGSDANTTDVRCKVAYKVVRYRQRVSTFSTEIDWFSLELSFHNKDKIFLFLPQHPLWWSEQHDGPQNWRLSQRKVMLIPRLNYEIPLSFILAFAKQIYQMLWLTNTSGSFLMERFSLQTLTVQYGVIQMTIEIFIWNII